MTFGEKMRAIREGKGIGLRKLAKELGVSPSFVSQIEKNKAQPSIDTLKKITAALEIGITDLIDDPHAMLETTHTQRSSLIKNRFNPDKLTNISIKKMVPDNIDNNMEPTLLILQPGAMSDANLSQPQGEEFLLVLSGQIEITLNDKAYTLQEGDNIYFNASVKHCFRNPTETVSKVLSGQSFLKVLFISSLLALSFAEPQWTLGAGSSQLLGEAKTFRGTTYSLGYTHNPFSRLQFGLRYEQTNIRCNTYENYEMHGLLGDIRFMFNTLTGKTPYIGYGFGWLNSVRSDKTIYYNARGSFAGEWLAGYSFKLDETLRFNLEYRQRCIELKYENKPYQRSETIVGSLSWIFIPVEPVQRSLTPEEGMTSKRDYLQKKINYNTQQMTRLDALIAKYDERVLEKGNDTNTTEERDYLVKQKQDLENQNTEMLKILE